LTPQTQVAVTIPGVAEQTDLGNRVIRRHAAVGLRTTVHGIRGVTTGMRERHIICGARVPGFFPETHIRETVIGSLSVGNRTCAVFQVVTGRRTVRTVHGVTGIAARMRHGVFQRCARCTLP
jgi:hypothetical protein